MPAAASSLLRWLNLFSLFRLPIQPPPPNVTTSPTDSPRSTQLQRSQVPKSYQHLQKSSEDLHRRAPLATLPTMAAFSRGLGLGLGLGLTQRVFFNTNPASMTLPERPMATISHAIHSNFILRTAHNLQTSARLHAAKKTTKQPTKQPTKPKSNPIPRPSTSKPPPPTRPIPAPLSRGKPSPSPSRPSVSKALDAPSPALIASVASELASRPKPTILYQSPSHFWLRFSCLTAAFFLIACAGINYISIIHYPVQGLSWWVPVSYSLVCLACIGLGYLFLISTARIVRRITAVPTLSLPPSHPRNSAVRSTTPRLPIVLECVVGGTMPFLGNRKLIVAPSDVLLPFKFVQAPVCQKKGPGQGGLVYNLRRGLTSEGFAPIMIDGKRFKIDVLAGEVFDNGRTLDVLMPYSPEKFTNSWVDRLLKR